MSKGREGRCFKSPYIGQEIFLSSLPAPEADRSTHTHMYSHARGQQSLRTSCSTGVAGNGVVPSSFHVGHLLNGWQGRMTDAQEVKARLWNPHPQLHLSRCLCLSPRVVYSPTLGLPGESLWWRLDHGQRRHLRSLQGYRFPAPSIRPSLTRAPAHLGRMAEHTLACWLK